MLTRRARTLDSRVVRSVGLAWPVSIHQVGIPQAIETYWMGLSQMDRLPANSYP